MPQKCPYWDIFGLPYCRLHQSQIPNVLPVYYRFYLAEWNKKSEDAKIVCCRCLHDAKVAAIKAELAAAAAKADDVLIDLTQKQHGSNIIINLGIFSNSFKCKERTHAITNSRKKRRRKK